MNNGSDSADRFTYKKGMLVERSKSLRGMEAVATRYTYDAAGRLTTETSTSEQNDTKRYEYDAKGRQTLERTFDEHGEPDGVLEYSYECQPPGWSRPRSPCLSGYRCAAQTCSRTATLSSEHHASSAEPVAGFG